MLKNKKVSLSVFILIIIAIFFASFFNFKNNKIQAVFLPPTGTNQVLYGEAWASNLGAISFNNCIDYSCSSTTGSIPYHVYLKQTGTDFYLDGFAWSDHAGWIQFGTGSIGNPIPCLNGVCGAKVQIDSTTGNITKITGWARAINGTPNSWDSIFNGWDGYISFGQIPPNPFYGVLASLGAPINIFKIQDFSGYAWGSSVIGLIDMSGVHVASMIINPPTCVLTPATQTINTGNSAALAWTSTNAASCTATEDHSDGWSGTITPVGGGNRSTNILTTLGIHTYGMSCLGTNGTTVQCTPVTATVVNNTLSCTMSPSTQTINSGGSAVLHWSSANATNCHDWSGAEISTSGSVSVSPSSTNTYTISCTGTGKSSFCSSTVVVASASCGNGVVEGSESCDNGVMNNGICSKICSASCTSNTCPPTPDCILPSILDSQGSCCLVSSMVSGVCPSACLSPKVIDTGNGQCVSTCSDGTTPDNGSCPNCSIPPKVIDTGNGQCVNPCSGGIIPNNGQCPDNCSIPPKVIDTGNGQCVSTCSDGTTPNNGYCSGTINPKKPHYIEN